MNLIQKLHALLVSDEVNIWHYPNKKDEPRFYYWLKSEPQNLQGHGFTTLEAMIEAAYAYIDPLSVPLPDKVEAPPNTIHKPE